jgi:5-dehydro-2-deoxygluconokinase
MLNSDRVYMLAADHRWQWEEWCDARAIARERIRDVKRLAYDGFLLARARSAAARDFGALLLDEQYSSAVIAEARRDGVDVGTPAEQAGAFPLTWSTDPFSRALTGAFVKVLVKYRPDHAAAVREEQLARLTTLQAWCREAQKPLVVEVLVPRLAEQEPEFEAVGRPTIVAALIGEAYRRGLTPEFWKIEGTLAREGARLIDTAIAEDPSCRQIILGKAADFATIARWFEAAVDSPTAAGFAIGRSVFWDPSAAFLEGRCTRAAAAEAIGANYIQLVEAWERPRRITPGSVRLQPDPTRSA